MTKPLTGDSWICKACAEDVQLGMRLGEESPSPVLEGYYVSKPRRPCIFCNTPAIATTPDTKPDPHTIGSRLRWLEVKKK